MSKKNNKKIDLNIDKDFDKKVLPYYIYPDKNKNYISFPLYEKMKYNNFNLNIENYVNRFIIIQNHNKEWCIGKIINYNNNILSIKFTYNFKFNGEELLNLNMENNDYSNYGIIKIFLIEFSYYYKKLPSLVFICSNFLNKKYYINKKENYNIIYSGFILNSKNLNLTFSNEIYSKYLNKLSPNLVNLLNFNLCEEINNTYKNFLLKIEYKKFLVKKNNIENFILYEIIFKNELYILLDYNSNTNSYFIRKYNDGSKLWINLEDKEILINTLKGPILINFIKNFSPFYGDKDYWNIFQFKKLYILSIYNNKNLEFNLFINKNNQLFKECFCSACTYHIKENNYYICYNCKKIYHKQCIDNKNLIIFNKFFCDNENCKPCFICKSINEYNQKYNDKFICTQCKKAFHKSCLEEKIKKVYSIFDKNFICFNCIKCNQCNVSAYNINKLISENKFNSTYNYCMECERKRLKKEFCPLCDQLTYNNDILIECKKCNYYYHKNCDRILYNNDNIIKTIKSKYTCPNCRINIKKKIIENFIISLENLDKDQFFIEPVDVKQIPNYLKVIKEPICFKDIKKKNEQTYYLKNISNLINNINLIFENAMNYNKPRDTIYESAKNLQKEVNNEINKFLTFLKLISFEFYLFDNNENLKKNLDIQDNINIAIDNVKKNFSENEINSIGKEYFQKKIFDNYVKWENISSLYNFIPYSKENYEKFLKDNSNINFSPYDYSNNYEIEIKILLNESDEPKIYIPIGNTNHAGRPHGQKKKIVDDLLQMDLHNSNFEEPRRTTKLNNYDFLNKNNNVNLKYLNLNEQNNKYNQALKEKEILLREYEHIKVNERKIYFLYPNKFKDYSIRKNDIYAFNDFVSSFIGKKEDTRKIRNRNNNNIDYKMELVDDSLNSDYDIGKDKKNKKDKNKDKKNKNKKMINNNNYLKKFDNNLLNEFNNNNKSLRNSKKKKMKSLKLNNSNDKKNKNLLNKFSEEAININNNNNSLESSNNKDLSKKKLRINEPSITIEDNTTSTSIITTINNNKYTKYHDLTEFSINQVCFSEFNLIFEKNCFLCGSFDDQKELIECLECKNFYHYYCISSYLNLAKIKEYKNWKCSNCKYCEKCHKNNNKNEFLYCTECNNCYHKLCLEYPTFNQNLLFKCEKCFECKVCKTKKFYNANFPLKKEKDYTIFTRIYDFCYNCGLKYFYNSLCKKCGLSDWRNYSKNLYFIENYNDFLEFKKDEKIEDDNNNNPNINNFLKNNNEDNFSINLKDENCNYILMIFCYKCNSWYHSDCIGFNYINLDKYYKKFNNNNFICIDCFLKDKYFSNYNEIPFIIYYEVLSTSFKLMCLNKILMLLLKSYQKDKNNVKLHTKLIKIFLKENYDELLKNKNIILLIILFKIDVYLLREKTNKKASFNINSNNNNKNKLDKNNNKLNNSMDIENEINYNKLEIEFLEIDKKLTIENIKNSFNFQKNLNKYRMKYNYDSLNYMHEKIKLYNYKGHAIFNQKIIKNKMLDIILSIHCKDNYLKNLIFHNVSFHINKFLNKNKIINSNQQNSINNNINENNLKLDEENSINKKSKITKINILKFFKNIFNENLNIPQLNFNFPDNIIDLYDFNLNDYFNYQNNDNFPTINYLLNNLFTYSNFSDKNFIKNSYKTLTIFILKIIYNSINFIRETLLKWLINSLITNQNQNSIFTNNEIEFINNINIIENDTSTISNNSNNINNEELQKFLDNIDPIIESPTKNINCAFCHRNGNRLKSGRLLNIKTNIFAHINCLYFSKGISIQNNIINNSNIIYNKINNLKCLLCKKNGATLICNVPKCERKFHFICAYVKNCTFANDNKIYCNRCTHSQKDDTENIIKKNLKKLFIIKKEKKFCQGLYNKFGNLIILKMIQCNKNDFNYENIDLNLFKINYDLNNSDILSINENNNILIKNISNNILISNEKQIFKNNINNCLKKTNIDELLKDFKINNNENSLDFYSYKKNLSLSLYNKTDSLENLNTIINNINNYFNINIKNYFNFPYNLRDLFNLKSDFFKNQIFPSPEEIININSYNNSNKNLFNENTITNIIKEYELLYSLPSLNNLPHKKDHNHLNFDTITVTSTKSKKTTNNKNNQNNNNLYVLTNLDDFIRILKQKNNGSFKMCFKFENYIETHQEFITGKRKLSDELNNNNSEQNSKENKKKKSISIENNKNINDLLPLSAKYRNYKAHPPKVCIGPSKIHRNGLFALDNFKPGEIVIEYVGEIITNKIADFREKEYNDRGFGDCYMFRVDNEKIIDATKYGNLARFINHCCEPNCYAQSNEINGEKHILLYAKKYIKIGEEITYDYNFESESEKIQCRCGAVNCRGRLN